MPEQSETPKIFPEARTSEKKGAMRIFDRLFNYKSTVFWEFLATNVVWGFEMQRWFHVNTRGQELIENLSATGYRPEAPPDPFLPVLQHIGDFPDGWSLALLGYYGASLISLPFKEKVPDEIKVAVGVLFGAAIVARHELGGLWQWGNTADPKDFAAGAIGAVSFAGFHMLLKRFLKDTDKHITELEIELKTETPDNLQSEEILALAPAEIPEKE